MTIKLTVSISANKYKTLGVDRKVDCEQRQKL